MKGPELRLFLVPDNRGGYVRSWHPKGSKWRPERFVHAHPDFELSEIVWEEPPIAIELPAFETAPRAFEFAGSFVGVVIGGKP